jgi:FkbM family methyltransferase
MSPYRLTYLKKLAFLQPLFRVMIRFVIKSNRLIFRLHDFKINKLDLAITPQLYSGQFERREIDWMNRKFIDLAKSNGLLIDIGANIGIYSVLFSSISKKYNVISVEPDVRNLDILNSNLADFIEPERYEVWCKAIVRSSISTKIQFTHAKDPGGSHLGFPRNRFLDGNSVTVEGITLDHLLEETKFEVSKYDFIFVKVDVEGYEFEVVNSGLRFIQSYKPTMLVEFGKGGVRENRGFLEAIDWLSYLYKSCLIISSTRNDIVATKDLWNEVQEGELVNVIFDANQN